MRWFRAIRRLKGSFASLRTTASATCEGSVHTKREAGEGTENVRYDHRIHMAVTTAASAAAPASTTARLVAAEQRGGARLTAASLVSPATILVAVGLLIPLVILFRYSLNDFVAQRKQMVEAVTLASYVKFFTDPYYVNILMRTLRVAFTVTALCLVLGFPLAYVLARTQSRYKNLLLMLVVLPLFVGNAVRAAGWMTLFGSKGAINATLMGLGIISTPLEIMYTQTAVIIGITAVNLPFMVLSLQSVIEGISRDVEEAAFSLGAHPLTMFRRVLLPLALPGVLAGTILTFILG